METRIINRTFKKDMRLYVEHCSFTHHIIEPNRDFIAIVYAAYGRGSVLLDGEKYDVAQKDIFIINYGARAEFTSDDGSLEVHFILFRKEFLQGVWESYGEEFFELESFFDGRSKAYIKVTDNDMNEIRNYIVRLVNEYYEDAPARKSALLGQMLSLLPVILRRYNIKEDRKFSKNALVDETIRQIRNTIYQNPKPSEIAAHRFVTTDHLGRVFKKETGMTVTQYINSLRVELTKDILQNTDRPIGNIPMLFNIKMKYLQQIFKKYTGMTMREYRSQRHYR